MARGPRPATAASPAKNGARLSADDWIRAAFEIMVDEGISGVKIPRLCERLGVTKGSFYWHFADLDTFLGALADRWGDDSRRPSPTRENGEVSLRKSMRAFSDRRSRNLTRAMRDWGQSDERARVAVRKADERSFQQVKAMLESLGFDEAEAEVRAKILYYAGVGYAHVGTLGTRVSAQEELDKTWEILTRRL